MDRRPQSAQDGIRRLPFPQGLRSGRAARALPGACQRRQPVSVVRQRPARGVGTGTRRSLPLALRDGRHRRIPASGKESAGGRGVELRRTRAGSADHPPNRFRIAGRWRCRTHCRYRPIVEMYPQRSLLAGGDHQRRGPRVLGGGPRRPGERGGKSLGMGIAGVRRRGVDARGRNRTGSRPRGTRRAHTLDAGSQKHSHDGRARREIAHCPQGEPHQRRQFEDHRTVRSGISDRCVSPSGRIGRQGSGGPHALRGGAIQNVAARRRATATRSRARNSSAITTSSCWTADRTAPFGHCGGAPTAICNWRSKRATNR